MFDLQKKIRAWCNAALPNDCEGEDQRAELEDHLLCEVERLERNGLSQPDAFAQATRRIGEARMIMNEYAKNQSFVGRLCALDRRLSGADQIKDPGLKKKASRLIMGHALLWSAAMIATALLSRDVDRWRFLTPGLFAGLWFASFLMINTTLKSFGKST